MRVKVTRTDEIIDADYEPECVIWTDDGGPYTWFPSVDEWKRTMLDESQSDVWYGTHNDGQLINDKACEMRAGMRVRLTWYTIRNDKTYTTGKAWFFTTPLYIDSETDDWYYPTEIEVLDDGDI